MSRSPGPRAPRPPAPTRATGATRATSPPSWLRRLAVLGVVPGLLGLLPPRAHGSWVPVGPPGGDVRALAVDPRDPAIVYLGTASGILYRSEDGGESWQRAEPGFPLEGMSLDDLAVSPQGAVYVGYWALRGDGGGVARSDDGGRTFTVLPGISGRVVKALALFPSEPPTIVVGTPDGVFRSHDEGGTFGRISPADDPEIRNVNSIVFDPRDPDTIYAGTWHLPWKTVDGGRTWSRVDTGMIDDSDVMTLTFDRRSSGIVFATACSGIYRSTDAGSRWTKLRGIPSSSRRTRAFAQDRRDDSTFFAGTTEGLWVTEDGGASWIRRSPKTLVVNALLARPDGTLLLGAEGAGVLRSPDQGRSWVDSNAGFSERLVSRVLFGPSGDVVAGVRGDRQHGGIFVAPVPAGPWIRLAPGLEGREVLAVGLAGETVLAGTDDGLYLFAANEWRRLPTHDRASAVHARVTDIATLGQVILAATSEGLLRSADGGHRVELQRLGAVRVVERVAVSGGQAPVALAASPLGFFESTDAGASWTPLAGGLGGGSVKELAFLPGSDRVVFAATREGLYRSEDGGRSWRPRGGGLPLLDITGLALGPDGRTVFASEFSRGELWRSDDAGETWASVPTEGLTTSRIWTLALHPSQPGALLAATPSGGLHEWRPSQTAPSAGAPTVGGR